MARLSVVLVVLLAWSAAAFGEAVTSKAKARDAYRSASKHYDLGEFREALADFKEAYRNVEDPTLLFNIGQCHRQLGEKQEAVRFFHTYLNKLPNAPNRDKVQELTEKLEAELQAEAAAPVPKTPEPKAPEPNAPEPKAPEPAHVEPPPPTPAVVPAVTPVVLTSAPPERKPVYKKWWLWTTVGIVVAAGVGVGLGIGLTQSHTPSASTSYGTVNPWK